MFSAWLYLLSLPPAELAIFECHPIIVAAAPTAHDQWVQIYNPCGTTVDLGAFVLRWTGQDYGFGASALRGPLASERCMTITTFDPPLQPAIDCADGIALFHTLDNALTTDPLDLVVYGGELCEPIGDSVDAWAPRPWQHLALGPDGWSLVYGDEVPPCPSDPSTRLRLL